MKGNIDEMYGLFGDGVYGSPDEIVVNGRTVGWKDNCIAFAFFRHASIATREFMTSNLSREVMLYIRNWLKRHVT